MESGLGPDQARQSCIALVATTLTHVVILLSHAGQICVCLIDLNYKKTLIIIIMIYEPESVVLVIPCWLSDCSADSVTSDLFNNNNNNNNNI